MGNFRLLCFVSNCLLFLAAFPARVTLSSSVTEGSVSGTLTLLNNMTQTCTCPGDSITYTCTVVGGEATLWSGAAFPSDCNVTLNHSKFSDIGGILEACRDQGIIGHSVETTNNCFTSKLTITLNSDSINRTVECSVVENSSLTTLVGMDVVSTTDSFPPPEDFRLRSLNLLLSRRLYFTWTVRAAYKNCSSLIYTYVSNCTDTCFFIRLSGGISCSNISTVARTCLFLLRISICGNITVTESTPVHVTMKVPEAPVISNASLSSSSFLDVNFTQGVGFLVSNGVSASIYRYNVTFMNTLTGTTCGTSSIFPSLLLCQNGYCIDTVHIPSFCDGVAISIMISASNHFGSGPNSESFNVKGIPGSNPDIESLRNSALQKLVGGVVGGVLAIIAALVSLVGALLKMNGLCGSNKSGCVRELKVTSSTATTVDLQWDHPAKVPKGVNAYKIEYSVDEPSSLKKSDEVNVVDTSFTITNLQPGTEYKINVKLGDNGTPTEIKTSTKERQYKLSIQVTFSIRNKVGNLASVLNKIINFDFKVCEIELLPSTKSSCTEHDFLVKAKCVCTAKEDKKQMLEEMLKTKSCARGITAIEESKVEKLDIVTDEERAEQNVLYCISFKSNGLHQVIIETVQQFNELNIKIDGIESYECTNSDGIHKVYIKCDCKNEETIAAIETRFKNCTSLTSCDEFLSIIETSEDERDAHHTLCTPYECTIRVNFPLCQPSESRPLMSALEMFQKDGLCITLIDLFDSTSLAKDVQQIVVLEYKQQILTKEDGGEIDNVMKYFKSSLENAGVEVVSSIELSKEDSDLLKKEETFGLKVILEDSNDELTVKTLKVLTDLSICIDSVSFAIHPMEQHLQTFTLKCTTELVLSQLIQEELIKNLKAIASVNEVNLQVHPAEAVPSKESLCQASDASLPLVKFQASSDDQTCHDQTPPYAYKTEVAATKL